MPLLAIRGDDVPDATALARVLADLPDRAPVVVMIHGYGYDPSNDLSDPHLHILALRPDRRWWGAVSWPRRLGLGGRVGLGVAWGWPAKGTIWAANAQAVAQGKRLAGFIGAVRALDRRRPLHVIGHSLGARVAAAALDHLGPGDVQRVLLMAPALSLAEARRACRSPAGRTAEFVNVTGRENRLFDLLLLVALPHLGRRLGRMAAEAGNWLDLPLGDPATREGMARLGWRIPPSRARICHWSGYLRPGVWRLYRDLLLRSSETPLPRMGARCPARRRPGLRTRRPAGSSASMPASPSRPGP